MVPSEALKKKGTAPARGDILMTDELCSVVERKTEEEKREGD